MRHFPNPWQLRPWNLRPWRLRPWIFWLLLGGAASARAQVPLPTVIAPPPAAPAAVPAPVVPQALVIEAGTGRLVPLPRAAAAVLAADPTIARVQPVSPTSLFLVGVAAGQTTVIATESGGQPIAQYEVTVRGGKPVQAPGPVVIGPAPAAAAPPVQPAAVAAAIRSAVPEITQLAVGRAGRGITLAGYAPTPAQAQLAMNIARGFLPPGGDVIDNLIVLSGIQVNVRVRVAEISREITRQLGFSWQVLGNSSSFLLGLHTGQAAGAITSVLAPSTSTNPPNLFGVGFNRGAWDVNNLIDALATDQLISVLAEPNLTAQSGETASFLAGGEFPIPVAASSVNNQVTIEFKQFGVSLSFVPTVLAPDRINLRVRPEVSQLSTDGAISLPLAGGTITVPALTVRRAETTVELGSGQSFAIAGLLEHTTTQNGNGLPWLGETPVLGALFKSDQFQRDESELVIIVTPYIVRPASGPGELAAPTDGFRPANDLDRILYHRELAEPGGAAQGAAAPARKLDAGFILE